MGSDGGAGRAAARGRREHLPPVRGARGVSDERPARPGGRRRQLEDLPRAASSATAAARAGAGPELAHHLGGGVPDGSIGLLGEAVGLGGFRAARAARGDRRFPARGRRLPERGGGGARGGSARGWAARTSSATTRSPCCAPAPRAAGASPSSAAPASTASASRRDGGQVRFPALGLITGDWGGGYDVGLAAVSAAARSEDGRGPRTSLERAIPTH